MYKDKLQKQRKSKNKTKNNCIEELQQTQLDLLVNTKLVTATQKYYRKYKQ